MNIKIISLKMAAEILAELKGDMIYRQESQAVSAQLIQVAKRASEDPTLSANLRDLYRKSLQDLQQQHRIVDGLLAQREQTIAFLSRIVDAGPQSQEDMAQWWS